MRREQAHISTPCDADWKSMSPRGAARLCSMCDKLVHDLSAMTEGEARALLGTRSAAGLCIRYLYDAEGQIWFGNRAPDRLVPAGRLARRGALMATAAALVIVPALTEACGGANPYYTATDSADAGDTTEPGRLTGNPTVAAADAGAETDGESDAARATGARATDSSSEAGMTDAANAGDPERD
jgi:hypothetical protein